MRVASSLALCALLAFAAPGCSKKKEKGTTPGARKSPKKNKVHPVIVRDARAKLKNCPKRPAGSKMITLDLDRNGKIDRWLLLTKAGRLICREMDMNMDGRRDLTVIYYADGATHRVVWWDLDYDGYYDQVMYNRPDGSKERVEVRPHAPKSEKEAATWKPTVWKYYRPVKGKGVVVDRIERDKDANGYKDYWERYENGVLKEVSWANKGDTDEKPKHWIEAPEQGSDKGYKGQDEPDKTKTTKPAKTDKPDPAKTEPDRPAPRRKSRKRRRRRK